MSSEGRTWKPAGVEMLPSIDYASLIGIPGTPGEAWIYKTPKGVAVLIHAAGGLLTMTGENIMDLDDADVSDPMDDYLRDCARAEITPVEALKRFALRYGGPDVKLELEDVDDSGEAIREAIFDAGFAPAGAVK